MKSKKANLKKEVKGPMKMKRGGYLEPDKELMFGGKSKYLKGGAATTSGRANIGRPTQEPKIGSADYPKGGIGTPRGATTSGLLNIGRPTQSGSGSPTPPAPAPKTAAGSGSAASKPQPKGSTSFNQAFAAARKAGQTTFTWNGKSYGTRRADETPEQHKAAMMRVADSAAPAPAAKPSEAKASEQAPQRATTLLRNTTPSLIPPSKLRPSISTSRGTSPGGKVTPREFANPNLKTSKVESSTMKEANKALKSDKKKSKIKAGGYLEPDKELMFGGKSKYQAGGMAPTPMKPKKKMEMPASMQTPPKKKKPMGLMGKMENAMGKSKYKSGGFPDLTGDGKVTKADILKGRGVIKEAGGMMEECGPGRPCPNAKKAAKTKKKQNSNLSRAQKRYMR